MEVIDLFSGMGGLASGFANRGYNVYGYDIHPRVPEIFEINRIGTAFLEDLQCKGKVLHKASGPLVVTGGPPCKPWSNVNRNKSRTGKLHGDYALLDCYFTYVRDLKPEVFLMENVLPVANDPVFNMWKVRLSRKYWIAHSPIRYSDYGAATARQRFFAVGFLKGSRKNLAEEFFYRLGSYRRKPRTVGQALRPLLTKNPGEVPDHHWPNFRTINNYQDKYNSNRFGWYKLDPDKPAPSFGSVMKTYILHPYAGNGHGIALRVISVREAMNIMGFPASFRFPDKMGMKYRYQMVADAVSPVFSNVAARVIREILDEL